MNRVVHFCKFTVGLDELTRKKQRDAVEVLKILRDSGRFSCFEATANVDIAWTMTYVFTHKLVAMVGNLAYPWTGVVLTPEGEALIAARDVKPDTEVRP